MVSDVRDAYLESKLTAADPIELVRMLYEGAIQSIGEARRQLNAGDIRARSGAITKAAGILAELVSSLDHERGGEIAKRLNCLYDYMLQRLADANREQVEAPLIEVAGLLASLDQAWAGIVPARPVAPVASYAAAGAGGGEYVPQSWSA